MLRHISSIFSITLASRVLGFFRDLLMARYFGTQQDMDIFLWAFQFPNTLRSVFSEGAFTQAFLPLLAEHSHDEKKSLAFIVIMRRKLRFMVVSACIILIFMAPWITQILAPGFKGELQIQAWHSLASLLPFIVLISMTTFYHSLLQAKKRFVLPAATPIIFNLLFILNIVMTHQRYGTTKDLAYGIILTGCIQWAINRHAALRYYPNLKKTVSMEPNMLVKKAFNMMKKGIIAGGIGPLTVGMDQLLASTLIKGSISWLYFAQRLIYLPVGSIAVAIATVALPALSRLKQAQCPKKFNQYAQWTSTLTLTLALPCAVGFFCLAKPMVTGLFQHGAFTHIDTLHTANAVRMLALGLPVFMFNKILNTFACAKQNMQICVRAAVKSLIANFLVAILAMPKLGHVGIAMATTISSCIYAGSMLKSLPDIRWQPHRDHWLSIGFGLLILMLTLRLGSIYLAPQIALSTHTLLLVIGLCLIGAITYTLALAMTPLLNALYKKHEYIVEANR